MNKNALLLTAFAFLFVILPTISCSKKTTSPGAVRYGTMQAEEWVTTASRSQLLKRQPDMLPFDNPSNTFPFLEIDSTQTYQSVDGFGFTLTGSSAYLINHLNIAEKNGLLEELFGRSEGSIGVSYIRISIGASDLNASVFSYDDLLPGETDTGLLHFSLACDTVDVVPLLKEIIAINPSIKILASPWSPPVWMKDNGNSIGGSLKQAFYNVYARYFVKFIQAMKANGINIDAVTLQNEPMHGGNNPSMILTAQQASLFVKNSLGPAFQKENIRTKIIVWDHNCNNPAYPIEVLNDAEARKYINGSAFHLYEGEISALSEVHNAHPDKDIYFTEQWTGANGTFEEDLIWHVKNVVIGSMQNWSKVALEWNLASDPDYNPHTPGGCTECKGAITIGSSITRNVSYYIIAHASRFIPQGSVRVSSSVINGISSVALITPEGKKVLLVAYEGPGNISFNIKFKNKWAAATLQAGTVATFVW